MKNILFILFLIPVLSFSQRDTIFVDDIKDKRLIGYKDSLIAWKLGQNQIKYAKAISNRKDTAQGNKAFALTMKDISKRKVKFNFGDASERNDYGFVFKNFGLIQPIGFRTDLMFDYGGDMKLVETKSKQVSKYELQLTKIYEIIISRWIPDIYKKPVQIVKHKIPAIEIKTDSIKEVIAEIIPEIFLPDKISFYKIGDMFFMFKPDSNEWAPITALTYYVAESNGENILSLK